MNTEVSSLAIVFLSSVLAIGTCIGAELGASPKDIGDTASLHNMVIQYKGPLISDTLIPGEGKSEGITPEISSCVQASRDKWIILFGTVDPRGHDTNRSLFYQIRKESPDGDIIKEGVIEKAKSNWDPLGLGHKFRKINAVVKVFGVPQGALLNGQPIPSANHFVAKWYTRPCLEIDGRLVNLWDDKSPINPEALGIHAYCLEWLQFRLNDAEDDIVIISPAKQLRQKGYNNDHNVISSLGPCMGMHHGFGDPVPNSTFSEWVEVCQFETTMAAVRYSFNPSGGLYEWVETGKAHDIPNRRIAESSLNRINDAWVICIRAYNQQGQTSWYRTSDPFESLGERTDVASPYSPRIAFVCADGQLRLFCNDDNPYGDRRNPLYCFDVDPMTFKYSNRQVVCDTRKEQVPFRTPFIDHAMVYPHPGGRRQMVGFRAINLTQTTGGSTTPDELDTSGIHYSELIYDKEYPNPWQF